jgi:sterol desaturase/sphingolipid hydroxylase (fatty acid hydroxylase superfamily)
LFNNIYKKEVDTIEDYKFKGYVIQAAGLECATLMLLPTLHTSYITRTIVFFIPVSFVYELIYDFFHYWAHRAMHITRNSFHKTHHHFFNVRPIVTFYQNIFDLILTIELPFLITHHIVSQIYPLSELDLSLIITYKIFVEIGGHTPVYSKNIPSFTQCIWLPRMLGIELYADDHALHHMNNGCNYSKRFSLWDKVFGTYVHKKNDNVALVK